MTAMKKEVPEQQGSNTHETPSYNSGDIDFDCIPNSVSQNKDRILGQVFKYCLPKSDLKQMKAPEEVVSDLDKFKEEFAEQFPQS